MSAQKTSGYGPLYAQCVLRPFAEQLIDALGTINGLRVTLLPGDAGVLAGELAARGATVLESTADAGMADAGAALATLGSSSTPDIGLATLAQGVASGGCIAAIHFTTHSRHEEIAHAALEVAGAVPADRWLEPLSPQALSGFTVSTVRDVVRFDSPRQFYAAMITERGSDAGLAAVDQRRVLAHCVRELAPVTTYDDTIRLAVEALLVVRR